MAFDKTRSPSPRPVQVAGFAVSRGALGAVELVLPGLMARWSCGRSRLDRRSTLAVRVLGGRQLGQALVLYLAPARKVVVAGAVVDGIHGATMLALAIRSTRWRPAALIEALVATSLAGLGLVLAGCPAKELSWPDSGPDQTRRPRSSRHPVRPLAV
jgi:hypothetical protein